MRLRRTELVLPWVLLKPPPTAGKAEMETISLSQVNQSQHLLEQRWRPTGIRWPRFWPQACGRNGHSVWILAPEFGGPRDPGQVGTLLSVSVLPILKMAIAMFATVSLCKL